LSRSAPADRTVIIGIGNPMRRDDGVGPAAVSRLRARSADADLVVLDGEATRLLDAWTGRQHVIVIDAATSGEAAGTVHRIDMVTDPVPTPGRGASSHGAGLAEAVELARVLDALPDRLVVYGVEVADVSFGEGLTPAVGEALDTLVERLIAEAAAR